MSMTPEKRAFLVDVIGEEKTAELEAALAGKERDLVAAGIGWKQATSFEALAVERQFNRLCDELVAIVGNIIGSDKSPEEKRAAVRQAGVDFGAELERAGIDTGGKGTKSAQARQPNPVDPYIAQLSPVALGAKARSRVRELEASPDPAGKFAAELVQLVQMGGQRS